MSIPKIIHYCWLGKSEKPEFFKKCIASWHQFMPDYEIIEWTEDNFDINCCNYVKDAYRSKKWAYVTDYIRLWCLEKYGGIYLDTDVQIIKSFDRFLQYRAFTSHETDELFLSAVIGAEPDHPWIKLLFKYYETAKFDLDYLVPNTRIITALSKPFIERQNYGFTYLKDGVVIFPITYFGGFDHPQFKPIMTEDTYAIHHFIGSWMGRDTTGRQLV